MDYISLLWFAAISGLLILVRKSLNLFPALVFIFLASAYLAFCPSYIAKFPIGIQAGMTHGALETLAVTLAGLLFLTLPIATIKIEKFIAYLTAINVFTTIMCVPLFSVYEIRWAGLIHNPSMNGVLLALGIPFLRHFKKQTAASLIFVIVLLILYSRSFTAALTLVSMVVVVIAVADPVDSLPLIDRLIFGSLFIIPIPIIGFLFPNFINPTERFSMYQYFMGHLGLKELLIGYGAGSFSLLSVFFQGTEGFNTEHGFYFYMHQDILQLVFEYGLLGVLVVGVNVILILRFLRREREVPLLSVFVGFLAASLTYYPFHFPSHVAFLFLLLKIVANKFNDAKLKLDEGQVDRDELCQVATKE